MNPGGEFVVLPEAGDIYVAGLGGRVGDGLLTLFESLSLHLVDANVGRPAPSEHNPQIWSAFMTLLAADEGQPPPEGGWSAATPVLVTMVLGGQIPLSEAYTNLQTELRQSLDGDLLAQMLAQAQTGYQQLASLLPQEGQ
jgi:hypothetical protein